MKNYWLEYELERNNPDLSWDPRRVQLLESLIRPTAQFGVELGGHLGQLSMFNYDSFVNAHRGGSCDQNEVSGWVYVDLLKKAVQDANAVALLRSESLWSQAINLWRSLFQTQVICKYIGDSCLKDHLACRYGIHSIIRPTVRRWEAFNETCRRSGKPEHYSKEDIERQKIVYEEQVGKWRKGEYAWANKLNDPNFTNIASATKSDMLFYGIANNEVHPTFGVAAAVTSSSLPLSAVPLLPVGITHNVGELSLEFQTAKSLSDTSQRVTDYAVLPIHHQGSLTTLNELAKGVLRDLSQVEPQ